ncbi:hypothetical protein LEP1GSC016_2707 [Leptospira borgpetersenii serovar Hardjo-bovis str. Sponselee]|uniref:Uncharacterized protein n=2 Tax=Leptospira borgpetersenii TaxID=174 RepID=M6BRC3_LEPBO|nr:hypothetical protein LEP1GSC016_2707 [Leptospira borgpetersenii serovar Hardjo-bovis str. Sponselee]EMO65145.1 hypothetical protein LEP1GSC133_1579 [Leptospira borgpetersenii serovar Pomona str. 200901868]
MMSLYQNLRILQSEFNNEKSYLKTHKLIQGDVIRGNSSVLL